MSHEGTTSPDSFFRDQALYGRFRLPTFIVIVTGIVWALQPVALYYALDLGVRENIQNAVAIDTMIHFLVPALLWVCFWVAFALLAHFFDARMRAGRLFKLTGWGIAPFALVGVVRGVGRYYAYQGATLPIGVTRGRFPSEWRGYHQLIGEVAGEPMLVGTTVVSCVFLLLSGYIWIFVVKYSTDLEDRKKIVTTVGVPIVIYIAYSIAHGLL